MKKASVLWGDPLVKTLIVLVISLSVSLGGFTAAFGYGRHRYIPNPAEMVIPPPEVVVLPEVPIVPVVPVVPVEEVVVVAPEVLPVVPVIEFNEPPVVVPQVLGETVYLADDLIAATRYRQRSPKVLELQTELKRLGFLPSTYRVTSFYGMNTSAAVKKYQAFKKIAGTETVDTINNLIANTKFGFRGNDVKQLQTELRKLGLLNIRSTGYYGIITRAAVKAYQSIKQN